ncbi:non-ribosomal peptide synthetase [Marilutibacter alkalisoli]|nr:non-ribosomal peptide synthetase [Lysobacter alkalisoli]
MSTVRCANKGSPRAVVDYDPFAGGLLERVVPTTEPQRELWLASRLGDEASLAFNESVSLHLRGTLDVEALRHALQSVCDRHDILRANFGPDGETLCIGSQRPLEVELRDLSGLDDDAREAGVQACLRHSVETPFDLGHGALFRATLLRLDPGHHQLVLSAHHIVCDGWSWWVLVRELGVLYAQVLGKAATGLSEPGLPEPESFTDYALEQALHPASSTFADDEAYWLSCFREPAPVLELPLDRPRPQRRSFASRRYDHVLDAELVAAVRRMGARQGASLFATLLAGFGTLVSRLSGQADVVVGIPAAGQSVDGHDHLIGHCVNLLPLRFDMASQHSFGQALAGVQGTLLDALDHQRYTFGSLLKKLRIERDPSRLPLVNVVFNIDQALDQESHAFPGLSLEFDCNPRSAENFELSINAVQVQGRLRLECQYNRDLFDEVTVQRWISAYEALLRAAAANPGERLASLPWLDDTATAELLALQPGPVAYDRTRLMHQAFETQCDRAPHRIAVRAGGEAWSYAELDARANRIARLLRTHGVHRGSLVGLALPRGTGMLAALLGVLKAGAGYVPLDPGFPADRLAYMVGDAGLAALLTDSDHADAFDLRGRPVLALDTLHEELAALPAERPGKDADAATPESVAYVIYTSGSTGRPKGVQVPHRAVNNFIIAMQREPGIDADDRLLAVTTLSFDIAVLELMLPLSTGAEVVIARRDDAIDGHALKALLASSAATVMQATPATWRLLVEAGWQGMPDFKALCGGEPMPADLAAQLLDRCGSLWNMYGPTETTVWSTCTRVEPVAIGERPDIHIGRPVANTRVWILDGQGLPCPRGVPGEICIAGDGVTLGYLDRPELTADRFVPESQVPFAAAPEGALLYRTGDRGRWRPDGNLEHLGRLDFQVKVRGYRIELGEIESVLAQHAGVARTVVTTREDRPGDVRLVAYVVPADAARFDEAALLSHLRGVLPEYMIPHHLMAIPVVPLLPNGKIDRKGLPAPDAHVSGPREPIAPRNATERAIVDAMEEVLGVDGLGVEDDFFANGGHSLIAAQVVSRINRDLGAALTLRSLFDAPTAARLAHLLGDAGSAKTIARPPIVRRADQHSAPLSSMQQRLWVLEQMQPGRVTWNTPSAHRLRGPFDRDAFGRAFQAMVCRQASLRTVIVEEGDGPVQRVRDDIDASLPFEDLGHIDEAERLPALMQRLEALIATPFRLDEGPLFVARLYRMGEDDHVLFFMTHHIIWDGWSFDVLYKEMSALYEAFSTGHASPLPELHVGYGDFAEWQLQWLQGGELARQLDFWKRHLTGGIEPLQLPQDRPRPPEATGEGSIEWLSVGRGTVDAMRTLAKRSDATLFMALLASYYILLHRLGGQRDLVVGLPVRNRDSEDTEAIMGFFVNMLPTRLKLAPSDSFLDVLAKVRAAVLDAFSHPDVPFDHLVRELDVPRDPSRAPLYQATFSFQDVRARNTRWGELEHEHLLVFQKASAGDLGLWFLEHGEGLSGVLSYNTDILAAASAQLINQRYATLLDSVLARPEASIGELPIAGEAERAVHDAFNATRMELPAVQTVNALLAAEATRSADRIALRHGAAVVDYASLHARAGRIAACLQARGVSADKRVGICLDRGIDLVAGMLAVMKLGAAYVPLDPAYPPDRLRFMVEDAGLALVVTEGELADPLGLEPERLFRLDQERAALDFVEPLPVATDLATPESAAYVIYTSGSTGKPKGVQVPHRAVVNFLCSMRREPGMVRDERIVAVTTTSFDIAVLELFLPLSVGAEIVLAGRETAIDAFELAALLRDSGAGVMQATPSTWRMLIDTGWSPDRPFKALCGGEPLAPDLARALCERCDEVWNMYGPTETTVWSTCTRIIAADIDDITIGRPIANTTVHILDDALQPCPLGQAGEICIGGMGVAVGYLGRPELTAERFVADRFDGQARVGGPGRLYRTGDLGRLRGDGKLQHLGRADHQVKLRGHRIELGEIEAALLSHPAVARAVVVTHEVNAGDVRLVAHVVPRAGAALEPVVLLDHLRRDLPAYMLPQHVVALDALPLLPNGKVDRNALPAPGLEAASRQPLVMGQVVVERDPAASTPIDTAGASTPVAVVPAVSDPRIRYLMQVWSGLLGIQASPGDNFFDLGGIRCWRYRWPTGSPAIPACGSS